ncbi:MAG: hypothetical protein AAGG68_31295 [Bacteroidota bacterium]
MFGITPTMEAMLRALAHYKYLTVSHIVELGISQSLDKNRKRFLALYERGLVDRQMHQSVKKKGKKIARTREKYLRYLTLNGARLLDTHTELELQNIKYSKKKNEWLQNDYFHRISTISIHIALDKRVEESSGSQAQTLLYYHSQKNPTSNRFEIETRLQVNESQHYTPDLIYSYFDAQNQPQIYCIEVYKGNRVGYIIQQLEKLFWILDNTTKIEQKVGLQTIPRLLIILDNPTTLQSVKDEIKVHPFFQVKGIGEVVLLKIEDKIW